MEDAPNYEHYSYDELIDAKMHIDKHRFPERYQHINELIADFDHKQGTDAEAVIADIDKYSTFWPRFFAAIIDGLVFFCVIYVECLIVGVEYSSEDNLLQAINGIQLSVYTIYMHGLYGQTLGKMAVGVKVLNHEDEKRINILQALRRESVNLGLNIFWLTTVIAISINVSLFGEIAQPIALMAIAFGILAVIWSLSEFVTMLLNHKRRALHDYIGRTVVVRV